jgi:hypothetical protein
MVSSIEMSQEILDLFGISFERISLLVELNVYSLLLL